MLAFKAPLAVIISIFFAMPFSTGLALAGTVPPKEERAILEAINRDPDDALNYGALADLYKEHDKGEHATYIQATRRVKDFELGGPHTIEDWQKHQGDLNFIRDNRDALELWLEDLRLFAEKVTKEPMAKNVVRNWAKFSLPEEFPAWIRPLDFSKHGGDFFKLFPSASKLTRYGSRVTDATSLAASPHLENLRFLALEFPYEHNVARLVLASKHLNRLLDLKLDLLANYDRNGLATMLSHERFKHLRRLSLATPRDGQPVLDLSGISARPVKMKLAIGQSPADLAALLESPVATNLVELDVTMSYVPSVTPTAKTVVDRLKKAFSRLQHLRKLELKVENSLSPTQLRDLLQGEFAERLKVLSLSAMSPPEPMLNEIGAMKLKNLEILQILAGDSTSEFSYRVSHTTFLNFLNTFTFKNLRSFEFNVTIEIPIYEPINFANAVRATTGGAQLAHLKLNATKDNRYWLNIVFGPNFLPNPMTCTLQQNSLDALDDLIPWRD